MNPAQVTVVGAGSQLLPVCVPACFEIHGAVGCADGDLVVNITCQLLRFSSVRIPSHGRDFMLISRRSLWSHD